MKVDATVGHQFKTTDTLVVVQCGECHVVFAMPESKRDRCKKLKEDFYCPNGHCRVYRDTEVERLREESERQCQLRVRAEAALDQTKAELETTERRRRAENGAKTRLAHRVAAGICPCCNRHFVDLHAHMDNKHPDYVKTV